MTFIHPYDDELVIAGQGTIGLEILDQLPDVDAVIVPIGGGGLISGVAFAIKSLRPEVKVYGVQAAGAPSMEHAFHDHKYETLDHVDTFADGIAVKTPGETTYEMVSQYVDDVVTVSEDEIAAAKSAIKTLGGHIVKVEDYTIPTSDVVHRLVIVEKVSPTPRAYPRAFAKIKKAPL